MLTPRTQLRPPGGHLDLLRQYPPLDPDLALAQGRRHQVPHHLRHRRAGGQGPQGLRLQLRYVFFLVQTETVDNETNE